MTLKTILDGCSQNIEMCFIMTNIATVNYALNQA